EWRMRPDLAGVRLQVTTDCCAPQPIKLRLSPRWGGGSVTVADGAASQWPASLLAGLGTPWNTLQFDGDLQLSTRGFAVEWTEGRVRMEGQADVQALRMASRLSTLRPIGSYRVSVTGGATPGVQLSTLEGALQLRGNGQWVASKLRFSGEASAEPDRAAALDNLLNIIGRREGARSVITIG
ncbi:MAG TPA: type II secretion system protein N, partial [Ramlibacter sp.]|nr:type II secretion system protein N [Ramlibacter sp.]